MKRLSHEDWTRMNAMTLEIHRSSTEEDLFDLARRLVREICGPKCEVIASPPDAAPNPQHLPLGPWTLRLTPDLCERSRLFLELLATHFAEAWERLHDRLPKLSVPLSKRQREVLPLLLNGDSNAEIGFKLGISARTVEKHIATILHLHGSISRSQLIAGLMARCIKNR